MYQTETLTFVNSGDEQKYLQLYTVVKLHKSANPSLTTLKLFVRQHEMHQLASSVSKNEK